jgi:hypothetical protein
VLLAISAALSACVTTTPFYAREPNPPEPRSGMGYVDFYVDSGAVPCSWTVTQTTVHRDLYGGTFTTEDRKDDHTYLAEIAASPHRVVRNETRCRKLGITASLARFQATGQSRTILHGCARGYRRGGRAIVPVHVNFSSPSPRLQADSAVGYAQEQSYCTGE